MSQVKLLQRQYLPFCIPAHKWERYVCLLNYLTQCFIALLPSATVYKALTELLPHCLHAVLLLWALWTKAWLLMQDIHAIPASFTRQYEWHFSSGKNLCFVLYRPPALHISHLFHTINSICNSFTPSPKCAEPWAADMVSFTPSTLSIRSSEMFWSLQVRNGFLQGNAASMNGTAPAQVSLQTWLPVSCWLAWDLYWSCHLIEEPLTPAIVVWACGRTIHCNCVERKTNGSTKSLQ